MLKPGMEAGMKKALLGLILLAGMASGSGTASAASGDWMNGLESSGIERSVSSPAGPASAPAQASGKTYTDQARTDILETMIESAHAAQSENAAELLDASAGLFAYQPVMPQQVVMGSDAQEGE